MTGRSDMSRSARRRPTRRAGFTLIEATMSVVIVSVMLVTALGTLGAAARARKVQADRRQGPALAQLLMSEIVRSRYKEPGGSDSLGRDSSESGGSRANWDDVDDYDGFSESTLLTKNDQVIANTSGWRWSASVRYATPAAPQLDSLVETGLKRVTATVTSPAGEVTRLVALRSRSSLYDQAPASSATYVNWVGMELQIGPAAASRTTTGVALLNPVAVP